MEPRLDHTSATPDQGHQLSPSELVTEIDLLVLEAGNIATLEVTFATCGLSSRVADEVEDRRDALLKRRVALRRSIMGWEG